MPVSKSVDFWQDVIDKYYSKYKQIHKTHLTYIDTAKKTGRLVSPFGRVYEFKPFIKPNGEAKWNESDITNYPNQGLGADIMAVARVEAYKKWVEAGFTGKFISTVHDSIVLDCPDHEVQDAAVILDKVFKDLPRTVTEAFGVEFNVPMCGEVSYGPNMKEQKEIKL